MWPMNVTAAAASIGVGFGTAGLGDRCFDVVTMALEEGFRRFDTAEAEYWYDQSSTGRALKDFFITRQDDEKCIDEHGQISRACSTTCHSEDLRVSTKIPPWSLTSHYDIRHHAATSRQELVGFCDHVLVEEEDGTTNILPYPLDVYYIHAPACWQGWHPRCNDPPPTLSLHDSWLAMEAIVGLDKTASRIGLSNVHPPQFRELITWILQRQEDYKKNNHHVGNNNEPIAPPRLPDVMQAYADPIKPAKELRDICMEHGIEFVSYSTLGTQHGMQGAQNPVLGSPVVLDLAKYYQRSTAEIVLQWARQHHMSVIPRSSKRVHIQELARLLPEQISSSLSKFELSSHDMERLDSLKDSV
mmetsp:Transcript_1435/g.1955  ORF Transcript_1435/g.1955 Transcript_1435/m.1955 type:complete len:358 (-) Transcript_1435:1611-2684(-)